MNRKWEVLHAAAVVIVIIAVCIIGYHVFGATTDTDTFVAGVTNKSYTYDTTGAVSLTVGTGVACRITRITFGLSAPAGAGSLTAYIDDGDFATIDSRILIQDMNGAQSMQEIYTGKFDLNEGDTLVLAYPNAGNLSYLLVVTWEQLQ